MSNLYSCYRQVSYFFVDGIVSAISKIKCKWEKLETFLEIIKFWGLRSYSVFGVLAIFSSEFFFSCLVRYSVSKRCYHSLLGSRFAKNETAVLWLCFSRVLFFGGLLIRVGKNPLKKNRFFFKKNPAQWFFWVFRFFLGFLVFLCFLPIGEGFRVFFSFKNTFRCIQTLNYNHSY